MAYVVYSQFLPVSFIDLVGTPYVLAQQLKMGKHVFYAFGAAIWLFLEGSSSDLYGKLVRGRTLRSFLAP